MADRFWEKVIKTDTCWLWTAHGVAGKWNYGRIKGVGKKGKMLGAHRFSWELHFGAIPAGQCVLHKCDNPRCVNPGHLFLGTVADNVLDMMQKERCGVSKLTADEVLRMRAEYAAGKFKQLELADRYGVSEGDYAGLDSMSKSYSDIRLLGEIRPQGRFQPWQNAHQGFFIVSMLCHLLSLVSKTSSVIGQPFPFTLAEAR